MSCVVVSQPGNNATVRPRIDVILRGLRLSLEHIFAGIWAVPYLRRGGDDVGQLD